MSLYDIKTLDLAITQIVPYWNNARKNHRTIKVLEKSIQEYGFNQPLVVIPVGNDQYEIVVGHTRYFACVNLKFETIPCYVAENLSEEDAKKYRIADNKLAEYSTWDDRKLIQEILSISDKDTLQDFMQEDISEMLRFETPSVEMEENVLEAEFEMEENEMIHSKEEASPAERAFRCPNCKCMIPLE